MRALLCGAMLALTIFSDAFALTVCTNLQAIRQMKQLQDLEDQDEMTIEGRSPASPQRQAIMRGLWSRYCSRTDIEPPSDSQQKLDALCTLHSGVTSNNRVYWMNCVDCQQAGIQCE
jgi:hypothetical protein